MQSANMYLQATLELCCFVGTLPQAWFLPASHLSATIDALDISCNHLAGSLPSSEAIGGRYVSSYYNPNPTNLTIIPMSDGPGFCGPIPPGMSILTAQAVPYLGNILPAASCEGKHEPLFVACIDHAAMGPTLGMMVCA